MATFKGFYGHLTPNPCTVLYYDGWYCVEGSKIVNYTDDPLFDGVNVEELTDLDCFTWSEPINTVDELAEAVNFGDDE